jgi:hypothetical protein
VVFLLAHVSTLAPARVVLVTHEEELRSVSLSRIQLGVDGNRSIFDQTSGGLAVDSRGERVFVVGVESTIAEIDLSTLDVRYQEIEGLKPSPQGGSRAAVTLDHARLAVFGEDFGTPGSSRLLAREPAGVTVIDTEIGTAWVVDAEATRAVVAADTLLVYGGRSPGVTGYSFDGGRRFRLFDDDAEPRSVLSVHAHGMQVYVSHSGAETSGLTVIDAVTGMVVGEVAMPQPVVELIAAAP